MAKILDPLAFPLTGKYLIEASAGTGKTYTITSLYLRLIVGHGYQRSESYRVDEILLVTFTEAATAELKDRVYKLLTRAHQDFLIGKSDDSFIQSLIAETDIPLAIKRLDLAVKQLDEAAIFTIHGFCQRVLTRNAFQTKGIVGQEFTTDESIILQEAVNDFWRKNVYPLDSRASAYFFQFICQSPTKLIGEIRGLLTKSNLAIIPDKGFSQQIFDEALAEIEQIKQAVKQAWHDEKIAAFFEEKVLSGNPKQGKSQYQKELKDFCEEYATEITNLGLWSNQKVNQVLKKGHDPVQFRFFDYCEQLFNSQTKLHIELKAGFYRLAIDEINRISQQIKLRQKLLLPDDLLNNLQHSLDNQANKALTTAIQQQYPVAFIDEFQDTDPVQYQIFKQIYANSVESLWVMIGDPKQAIYGFRGADIFTYIQAKREIPDDNHYSLSKNWRSQKALVKGVNKLFEESPVGFLFNDDIPFYPVDYANKADAHVFRKDTAQLNSLNFRLLDTGGELLSTTDAKTHLAVDTANQIAELLSGDNNYRICEKPIEAADICVLVRNRIEAHLIKQTLNKVAVSSVFLIRESVFSSVMAKQLFTLLKALYQSHNEEYIRASLISDLLGLSVTDIHRLNQDESEWQQILEVFQQGQEQWLKFGVLAAINHVVDYFDGIDSLLILEDGERHITDFRHLSELLQTQSLKMQGMQRLLRWFEHMHSEPDENNDVMQLRLESDSNLVQIVTMHSSKGLEYPIVFIPFACTAKVETKGLFHSDNNLYFDLGSDQENLTKADYERLAEDMRLLYVALTRAVNACFVGIFDAKYGKTKQSSLAKSAFGHLLLGHLNDDQRQPEDIHKNISAKLKQIVEQLDGVELEHLYPDIALREPLQNQTKDQSLKLVEFDRIIEDDYRVTSFSSMTQNRQHLSEKSEHQDDEVEQNQTSSIIQLNVFSFPRGANPGSFLHAVLENWDFSSSAQLTEIIQQQAIKYAIDDQWHSVIESWMKMVVNTPLDGAELTLNQLEKGDKLVEMEFMLPIENLSANTLNAIVKQFSKTSFKPLRFEKIKGMMKGYIDLIFSWQGRYYVLDYKSNYLGGMLSDYDRPAMIGSMIDHDYFLQAWFYSLALHRYLKAALPNYDYEQHFGGCYYLFLRGVNGSDNSTGVFTERPSVEFIESLDRCFSGQAVSSSTTEQLGLF